MPSIHYMSASELVKRIKSKDITPIALMEETIKRVEEAIKKLGG